MRLFQPFRRPLVTCCIVIKEKVGTGDPLLFLIDLPRRRTPGYLFSGIYHAAQPLAYRPEHGSL